MIQKTEHWKITKPALTDADGMVAAQHHLAAAAGGQILANGGNAIDAAVAAALALGVVEPWMCGLGGSGLMVVWLAAENRAVTLDFQGVLARATRTEDYPVDPELAQTLMGFPTVQGNANVEGYRSITVPGAAAGFDHAVSRWGRMSLAEIAEPAIRLAKAEITADWFTTLQVALAMQVLEKNSASAAIYLPEGHPIPTEQRWSIPGLASTLERFAQGGAEAFYRGNLAHDIVADLTAGGSSITAEDLASYEAIEEAALSVSHRGAQVHAMGDVSGGTRLHDFLGNVAKILPNPPAAPTPESWCVYATSINLAWRTHNTRIGRETEKGSCTSHLSTADRDGNMVALTHTLLNRFGSGVTLPKTGLLMNNAVSYFDPRQGFPTTMAPYKRINASNMCPTIVSRNDKALLAVGASGGNQIMPAVAQIVGLILDFGMTLEQAMNHARLDASDRGSVRVDPALGQQVIDALAKDHQLEIVQRMVFPKLYACPSAVASETGRLSGLNDPSQPIGGASGPADLRVEASASEAPVRA